MANSTRMSMQKRMREQKKQEKAALKRDQKSNKKVERGNDVASADDLADYGAVPAPFSDKPRD
jgi:hypothetical protein